MGPSLNQRLAAVELLSDLSPDDIERISSAGTTLTYAAGRQVVQAGARGPGLRLVLDGEAVVDVGGVERTRLQPGDHFGEISLLDHLPASATVTAGEAGLTTFAISPANFGALLDANPGMARVIIVALCRMLRAARA